MKKVFPKLQKQKHVFLKIIYAKQAKKLKNVIN